MIAIRASATTRSDDARTRPARRPVRAPYRRRANAAARRTIPAAESLPGSRTASSVGPRTAIEAATDQ
jgi:hypothetical protein